MKLNRNHATLVVVLVLLACAVGLYIWHNSRSAVSNDGPVADAPDAQGNVEPDTNTVAASGDPLNSAGTSAPQQGGAPGGMVDGASGLGAGDDQAPVGQNANDMKSMDAAAEQLRQAACFPREQLMPEELLPQDNSSTWAQVNPQGQGSLKGKSFLQAGWATGINTVGSSNRNPSLDLRSETPNPQVPVSPWMNSTIEPDTSRRPLEIGGCA